MSSELIINSSRDKSRIGLLKDKKLVEFHQESDETKFNVGDIYVGKVKKINKSLNAAFIDIGFEKDAFLHPYSDDEGIRVTKKFYNEFFYDNNKRILLFGINPGRIGGGLTGIPFTDPYHLKNHCGIDSKLDLKKELSSTLFMK